MRYIPKTINYDEAHDILYCTFASTENSYGDELDKNLILLKDIETDEITGVLQRRCLGEGKAKTGN